MQLEISQLDLRYASMRIRDGERTQRLVASLCELGQQTPVLVVRGAEENVPGDHFVLIDGYARVDALHRLGRDVVEVAVLEVAETEALVVGFRLDATRHRSALEEGWLLQELRDGHGLGLDELVNRLGRSKSWVSRRLALVNVLPAAVQSEVQKGRQSAQVATKYLVPLARANAEQCTRLVSQLDGARLSVRDAGRWYAAWRKADPELKSRLVEHPQLFLQAEASTHGDEDRPPDDEVTAVIGDLGAVAGICVRARTRMDKRDVVASGEVQRRMLGRAFTRAREAFGALSARLEEESV